MKRVASLYLPEWPLDRLRRGGKIPKTSPERPPSASLEKLGEIAAAERAVTCSVPNTPEGRPGALWAQERERQAELSRGHRGSDLGWRPGAKWAKAELAAEIEKLPAHQRPPMRELGRRSEVASHPFKAMRPNAAGSPRDKAAAYPGEGSFFLTGRMSGGVVSRACSDDVIIPASDRRFARQPSCAEPPVVTAHRIGDRDLVCAANGTARTLGIEPGIWVTQARVVVGGLSILPADPDGDRVELRRLAVALAKRWAPCVMVSDDRGLFIDLTGVAHLHGGEEPFLRRLHCLLNRLGFRNQIAVADTIGAAWALARYRCGPQNPLFSCAAGEHAEAIAALPVEALRIQPDHMSLLDRLGVGTAGELARLPRAPLMRRFGGALVRRLDQATGRAPEPLEPVETPERIIVTQRFFEPIATAQAIEHWLGRLVPQLAAALAQAGLGARSVLLVADRVDGRAQTLRVGFARPNRQPDHLLRLLRRRIEEIDPGFGIDALSLHILHADPLGPEALVPTLAEEQAPDLAPLVDLLANRIGQGRIWRLRPVESDVPERSVVSCPPLDPDDSTTPKLAPDDVRQLDAREADHPWHPRWPRPARLLPRPEPVKHVMAEMPDHPPRRFTWRGESHRVVRADGPERIIGEWWRRAAERDAVRDYFTLEDQDGRRFWLYRRGDGVRPETGDLSWHLHGAYA